MVADSLVYHPTVAHYIRFLSLTGNSSLPHPPKLNSRKMKILTYETSHSRP